MRFSSALLLLLLLACATWTPSAQATTDADVNVALHEAELRKALAEADRAEWLARLPPSAAKPPAGAAETSRAGVAALMKSVDLAMQLAAELCAALPSASKVALYEPASTQGIVAARTVDDGLLHTSEQLARQLQQLQRLIERYTPQTGTSHQLAPLLALATVPATIKSAADISALFKSDVALAGIAYGEGARTLFATALFKACPRHVAGLGAGYLGELDPDVHAALLERVRALAALRGEFAHRIEAIDALADSAKGAEKRLLAHSASNAGAMLKTVDAFIESLKAGETGDKSPLYNAARFLAHAARTRDALLLDFDLRLDGVTLAKDGLFTGERVRVAGAAILWYRLHAPDGTLLQADALRRVSTPVELDLRAAEPFR
jgi:hypothetical protein